MSLSFALGLPVCPVTLIISAYLTFLLYHCFIFNTSIPYLSDLLSKLFFGWFSVSGMGIHLFCLKHLAGYNFSPKKFLFDPLYAFLVMIIFQYGGGYQILAALYWLYHKDIIFCSSVVFSILIKNICFFH